MTAFLVKELAAAAEKERAPIEDLFVLVYDKDALDRIVQPLFEEELAVPGAESDGVAIIIVPAEDASVLLSAVELAPPAAGPGCGVGALLDGTGLTTRLVIKAPGAAA